MTRHAPPAIARLLLESVLPLDRRDAILGDLIEEHALNTDGKSGSEASRWFWSQTCRSLPFLAWSSLRNGWLLNLVSAVAVYVLMQSLEIGANLTIARLFQPGAVTHVVVAPIVFLAATAVAGCVAARVRRGATVFLSLFVFITVGVSIARNVCMIPVPWWYEIGFLTMGPASVFIAPVVDGLRGFGARKDLP